MTAEVPRDNLAGAAWLMADISLNTVSLSIVKALGGEYPAVQLVFLRAAVGLVLIAPLIWRRRDAFRNLADPSIHALRVGLSVITLTASFYALPRVPLALFTAIGFTRPLVTMLLAALLLSEPIGRRRWVAGGVALVGVLIAVGPAPAEASAGLVALAIVVLAGSGAVVATRRLRAAPSIVLMGFYTGGLSLATLPFALAGWVPVSPCHILPLLAIGVLAQAAQTCFLRAHYHGEAGVLSVLSYTSLVFSVVAGAVWFGEVPGLAFAAGAALVMAAALWVAPGRSQVTRAR